MKKFVSVLLVFVMLFGLAAPACAASSSTKVEFEYVDLNSMCPDLPIVSQTDNNIAFGPVPISKFNSKELNFYNLVNDVLNGKNSRYCIIAYTSGLCGINFHVFEKSSLFFQTTYESGNPRLDIKGNKLGYFYLSGPPYNNYGFVVFTSPKSSFVQMIKNKEPFGIYLQPIGFSFSDLSVTGDVQLSAFPKLPQASNLSFSFLTEDEIVSHNLIINYQYPDGTKAAESVTQSLETDAAYSIPSPTIPGYTPDQTAVTGTMPDSDQTITVTYTKNSHNLTVNYQYEDGEKAADSVSRTIGYNEPYSIPSPFIEGYKPSQAAVAGNMPDNDLSVDVVYSKNKYNLNVSYLYEDGSEAAEPVSKQVAYNSTYSIFSPSIPGYTPDKPTITGIMKAQDLSATVTYKQNKHDLTVSYFYENGLKAAESVTQTVGYNDAYSIVSPEISGYLPDKPTVSGKMPDNDLSVRVVYSAQTESHSVTVNYVYADGTTAADSKVNRYPTGFMYHLESPTIEGYKADIPVVSGQMQNEDITVTVTYTKDEESGGNSGGDNPGGGGSGGETPGGGGDSGGGSIFPPVYPPYDGDFPFIDYSPDYNGDDPFDIADQYPSFTGSYPFIDYSPKYNGENPFDIAGQYPAYTGPYPFTDYSPEYTGDNPFDIAGQYPMLDPAEAAQDFIDYYKGHRNG